MASGISKWHEPRSRPGLGGNVPYSMIDGELEAQRWWVQAKGRTSTVPPQTVREAIVDVQAYVEVDVLVIATNSRFSNDTRDWVAEFQATHPRPVIRLWDRDALERKAGPPLMLNAGGHA